MDTDLTGRIQDLNSREKRAMAESIYTTLKGMLTHKGYRNVLFEEGFIRQKSDEQIKYLSDALSIIQTVEMAFTSYAPVGTPRSAKLKSMIADFEPAKNAVGVWQEIARHRGYRLRAEIDDQQNYHSFWLIGLNFNQKLAEGENLETVMEQAANKMGEIISNPHQYKPLDKGVRDYINS